MVSVTVRFLHLAGILVGGGTALATDRRVLLARRRPEAERAEAVMALGAAHRVVLPALAIVVASGLLMLAADTQTFLYSRLYWCKMGLVTLLLLNGVGLLAAERAVSAGRARAWTWLGFTSAGSLVLWFAVLFAGVWLTAAA
jgi:hypothetical protein